MNLVLFLYPHQNIRYRASLLQITMEEVRMALGAIELSGTIVPESIGGAQCLSLSLERAPSRRELQFLWQCAGIYLMCERKEESLIPLNSQAPDYIGEDLPLLLKYKGKTNEMFTDSMITMALSASNFSRNFDSQLIVCDPMAGKGTTALLALRRGYHGVGIEISKSAVNELENYMTRYFEYHRIKFKHQTSSLTVRGRDGGHLYKWVFSDSTEHFRDGDTRSLRMILGDTRDALAYLKNASVHLMVTDLPYGVQTGPASRKDSLLGTVQQALPGWYSSLKPGGTLAMSYNTHTIRRDQLQEAIEKAGFVPVETGSMVHWVEQAVERDLIIGKKEPRA